MAGALRAVRDFILPESDPGSGPRVARVFHRLLALVFLDAWLSLGTQVHALVGVNGLLPLAEFVPDARAGGLTFARWPSLFLYAQSDGWISLGVWLGVGLALAALAGFFPRACAALSCALYLTYAVGCRTFTGFQWDNLLLECALLAVFLPRDRDARWIHFLFRVLFVKLYVESGIAKWQSNLHDWHDGSAMTYYFETAPLPAWPGWYTHHEPAFWHHFESRATLFVELVVPWLAFGRRRARLVAVALLTVFQVINLLTANYGFFVYIALALHLFLFTDDDLARASARVRAGWNKLLRREQSPAREPARAAEKSEGNSNVKRAKLAGAAAFTTVYLAVSALDALVAFAPEDSDRVNALLATVEPLRERYEPFRLVNTYHLFGHITRERVEAEFQTLNGSTWTAHDLWYKPGDPSRAPGWVAPHQPRLDFQLWFYGLTFRRGTPAYVVRLVQRMCHDPDHVAQFFRDALPAQPIAARVAYWQYHFSSSDERRATGHWWTRTYLGATAPLRCSAQ